MMDGMIKIKREGFCNTSIELTISQLDQRVFYYKTEECKALKIRQDSMRCVAMPNNESCLIIFSCDRDIEIMIERLKELLKQ